ncbi:MAG: flagellin [Flavobacteriaceae bacterium]
MSEIVLSKAVRSNLLNLQNTASLLSKTQERLSTGKKVNSALDNPTNFFTASSLNSRASDLGRLLDSVSNAIQTIEAADNGISAITKLVETAQSTARQALQTANTVETTTAATAGTFDAGTFSAVDVSGAGASASAGTLAGGAFSALDLSGAGSSATAGTLAGGAFSTVDISTGGDAISFDVAVDGGSATTITIDAAAVTAYNTANSTTLDAAALTAQDIADLINDQAGAAIASLNGGNIDLASTTTGSGSSITVSSYSATVTGGSTGISDGTDTGDAAVPADSISFDLTVDGGSATTITIDAAAVTAYNTANSTTLDAANLSAQDVVDLINDQAGATVASLNGGNIDLTSTTTGAGSSIAVSSYAATVSGGSTGIADGSDTGSAASSADSISFDLTIDGGTATTITIDDAAVTAYNTANSTSFDSSALTAANIAALINDQAGATVATVGTGGDLTFTSATTGTGSSVAVSSYSATVSGGSTGIADASDTGSAASTTQVANPKRDEYVTQFNELRDQIDQLAKDAGFNGVNLLNGDSLSVLFNEDGSSSLDITGVSYDSAGLGITAVASGGFDDNADINAALAELGSAIDTLRTQSSAFGSNLSIVETRQDFTNNLINTLETGASNLTLADTNEEAANLLALQTRQQLSSTALSLASQADQNVLRLF